jgi:ADP-heptose:LPS heptosyltransferase
MSSYSQIENYNSQTKIIGLAPPSDVKQALAEQEQNNNARLIRIQHARIYIRFRIVEYTRDRGIELFDNPDDMGRLPKMYPHWVNSDAPGLEYVAPNKMQFVCIVFPKELDLKRWWRVIKDGGYLIICSSNTITNVVSRQLKSWDLVRSEIDPEHDFSFQVFKKTSNNKQKMSYMVKPLKTAGIIRYGGFGDMIQISGVIQQLKEQDYHITLYTSFMGEQIARHDPHIDKIITQGVEQVANEDLGPYWKTISKYYDLFINFSESVEGSLLALPDRIQCKWNKQTRHVYMNRNYTEFIHMIGGVPHRNNQMFYPTRKEREWAETESKKVRGAPIIMWALSGSSVHKVWPYQDEALKGILGTLKYAHVFLMGDENARNMLTLGWEKEPRVHTPEWDIRQVLSFAEKCHCVIGPETGVLNAVGLLPDIVKILFLSHSTPENLCKHWRNTSALGPVGCDCYPCHILHKRGWETCVQHPETGCADCASKITLEAFFTAFQQRMDRFRPDQSVVAA